MNRPLRSALAALAAPLLALCAYSCGNPARVEVAPDPGPDFNVDVELGSGGSGVLDEPTQCQEETREAVALGLDIYVMLDSSLSMDELLPVSAGAGNQTKWDAVQEALRAFIAAPATAEIGVGLQYFPQVLPDVPFSCGDNDDCGPSGGACSNSKCVESDTGRLPSGQSVSILRSTSDTPCLGDNDCGGAGESCVALRGQCIYAPGDPDFPQGSLLPAGVPALCATADDCRSLLGSLCEEVGVCEQLINGEQVACTRSFGCPPGAGQCSRPGFVCTEQKLCNVAEYDAPAVPIRRDAARVDELLASLSSRQLAGPTPTGPALQGALQYGRSWAAQNPDRQVITVVVTDGFPTDCSPQSIPQIAGIAEEANEGEQPVHTFFVGVFSDQDLGFDGVDRLDTLARAGGSEKAVVINTSSDVAQDFLSALDAIRDASARCNFKLGDAALDLERVNLEMVDQSGQKTQLFNVGNSAACGTDQQGWFYESDSSGIRRQIRVCPSTCRQFISGNVTANLQIGCATRIR